MRRYVLLSVIAWSLGSSASVAQAPAPSLQAGFDERAVVTSGVTPGGDVIVWGIYRERVQGVSTRVGSFHQRLTADKNGTARLDLGRDVPALSAFAAVDLTNGQSALASPGSFQLRAIDPGGRRIDKALGRLAVDRSDLAILFVRPGTGSWDLVVHDGGPQDEDGAFDGSLRASLTALLPDAKTGNAPPKFQKGDVLIAVDPNDLSFFELQLAD